jgi:nucleoside-diphosphate-sugar epimerase
MKIFIAGASGAVGRRLLPMLARRGHSVVATTRSAQRVTQLRTLGAEPVVVDAFDRAAVVRAIESARPEVVVHQLTALAHAKSLKHFDREFAATNRLRTEGTDNLLAGARAAGVQRFIAQSFTGWTNPREGSRVKNEDDPLDPHPPHTMQQTLDAIRYLERAVSEASGVHAIVLRYGYLYGPGTSFAPGGDILEAVRSRRFPIAGSGAGVWSFVHVDDIAMATVIAAESAPSGLYNVVDDEPAEAGTWLPELARVVGAKPPRHVPVWLARLMIGDAGVALMTQSRGSSNVKIKRAFAWQPLYRTWRDGFRRGLSDDAQASAAA